jgi:hypothetical protein
VHAISGNHPCLPKVIIWLEQQKGYNRRQGNFAEDAPVARGVRVSSICTVDESFMKESPDSIEPRLYQAPLSYVGGFYLALIAWTIISVSFLGLREWTNWTQLFIIVFILVFTWYFSLGISYIIRMDGDGTIWLRSFRKVIRTHPREMQFVEGPHLPMGFVRFRLEREKTYLFCVVKDRNLQAILSLIRKTNPDIKFKNLFG